MKLITSLATAFLLSFAAWSQDAPGDYEQAWKAIREEWTSQVASARAVMREKAVIHKRVTIMTSLLSNAPPGVLDAQIARLSSTNLPWINDEWGWRTSQCAAPEYETVLLESVTDILINRRDIERLRALLIVNCPTSIGWAPLGVVGTVRMGPEFLELLTDCWEIGGFDARRSLLHALEEVFATLRSRYPPTDDFIFDADSTFVNACRDFLAQHKGELVLNDRYYHVDYTKFERGGDLLLWKSQPAPESWGGATNPAFRSALKSEWFNRAQDARKLSWDLDQPFELATPVQALVAKGASEMYDLLTNAPRIFVRAEIDRLKSEPVNFHPYSSDPFETVLASCLVDTLIKQKNQSELKEVLLMNCPPGLGAYRLEYLLVRGFGPKAIYRLFDCYRNGRNDAVKKSSLNALAEAFEKLRRQHANNEEFVRQCEAYVDRNLSRLSLNPDYLKNNLGGKYRGLFLENPRNAENTK